MDAAGNFDLQKAKKSFRDGRGLGQVGRPSDAGGGKNARGMAELTNAIQKFFLENSRLGIPVIFHEECLHGHAAPGWNQLSAAHCAGSDLQSRVGRVAIHDDGS